MERGDPAKYGGEPPIRFIHDLKDTHEESVGVKLHNRIKFDSVEQNFHVFNGGSGEDAIRHLCS